MNYGVSHRHGSDLAFLWLWHRQVAVAPVGPLAWEPPYATGTALKRKKDKTKKKKKNQKQQTNKTHTQMNYIIIQCVRCLIDFRLKLRWIQGCIPFSRVWVGSFPCHFQLLQAGHIYPLALSSFPASSKLANINWVIFIVYHPDCFFCPLCTFSRTLVIILGLLENPGKPPYFKVS